MFKRSTRLGISLFLLTVFLNVGCPAQQSEQLALQTLREMTRDGKLPPEYVVAGIETRFAGTKTGTLAKLLHARIQFENNDFTGAAARLNSAVFGAKTKVADYAYWLRGQALQKAGNHSEALYVFSRLLMDFPDSICAREARLAWANSALAVGRASEVPPMVADLVARDDLDAIMVTAKAYEAQGIRSDALKFYTRVIAYGLGSKIADDAKARATVDGSVLAPPDEFSHAGIYPGEENVALAQARYLYSKDNFARAAAVYERIVAEWYSSMTSADHLRRLTSLAKIGRMVDAQNGFAAIVATAPEKEAAYRALVLGYAKAKMWPQARTTADEMRQKYPSGPLVAKTFVDAGMAARDAKNKADEVYFLNTAVAAFPNAVEVAQAQFETAWMQHDNKNYAVSSSMLIDHLARYADKDTTNRGKAGYWAARDSERAGRNDDACLLYTGVNYRYNANWYGYLAGQRLAAMQKEGKCSGPDRVPLRRPEVDKAIANLKTVTVAAETATVKEIARTEKSDELSTIGLFDWAIDELNEAKKTADKSPKINLALAKYYRQKGDNVNALLALAKSYPDYAQMFPEEMGREEWDIFYPVTNWSDIKSWAQNRGLDKYQVAGLIRQESVFDPRAKSGANAYGLMQLLVPTARVVAKSYGSSAVINSGEDLFQPAVNIELGTAYMKDQFAKFGRIEYVAVAYNAGPNRVAPWRATLPAEMDEFVEAIPFKETKAYVQGVIRNSAQYRRLYDDNGNWRANVGARPLRGEIDTKPRDQFVAENPDISIDNGS